ncbi:GNAT family N-acetyltransferase [Anaeromicropila herbilytica]|uniref:N-acetyltransferase domain-containing protein n=1 Tax=Anaeromicropila herbilytica TaxID=2785025 RepID=A0A7R7EK25_9FIRM|nr:GNAT family N-acetyltransferase [Anaeromicropila herbilytica]BCN30222.1 hypothetical protein bsdtb5_15170 [Anaeromicropila herbilytica]
MEIINYNDTMLPFIIDILSSASQYVKEDIIKNIKEFPQNARVVKVDNHLAAIAIHTGIHKDKVASFTLFVDTKYRGHGIGTSLIRAIFADIRHLGINQVIIDFEVDSDLEHFVVDRGMTLKFQSSFMGYTGERLENHLVFRPYEDNMYKEVYRLKSKAFYDLRRSIGIKPYFVHPSESSRKYMELHKEGYYVLKDKGKIIALGYASGNEIDDIAVAKEYRGQGIGRELVSYGINKLRRGGNHEITLWVVQSDVNAVSLYKSIGFTIKRTHQVFSIEI